jgi:hypothetical protein
MEDGLRLDEYITIPRTFGTIERELTDGNGMGNPGYGEISWREPQLLYNWSEFVGDVEKHLDDVEEALVDYWVRLALESACAEA